MEDRRVRKTKKALMDSFAILLQKKPLKNITVREIAELADINRGTFYLHYKDVYDMAEQIQKEIYTRLDEIISEYVPSEDEKTLVPVLVKFFEMLTEYSELAKSLIGKNGDAEFAAMLRNMIRDKCFSNIYKTLNLSNNDSYAYFYCFTELGCIGILERWLIGGMKESPADMAMLTEEFILKGLEAVK